MTATNYIWDFDNDSYLMEKDDSGATTAVYTNEPVQYGQLVSQRRGSETSYYHFDGQGSTRQLTNGSGNVTDSYTYSAFGETVATSEISTNPFRYCGSLGYLTATSTEGIDVRARTYDRSLGRWWSRDPLEFVDSTNQYGYVRNRATFYVDPSGLREGRPPVRRPPYRKPGPGIRPTPKVPIPGPAAPRIPGMPGSGAPSKLPLLRPSPVQVKTNFVLEIILLFLEPKQFGDQEIHRDPLPYPRDVFPPVDRRKRDEDDEKEGDCICFDCDPPIWNPYRGDKRGKCKTDNECKQHCLSLKKGYKTGVCSFT